MSKKEEEKKEERKPLPPLPPLEEAEPATKGPKVGCGSKVIILTKPNRTVEV
jgi:hypothetical protein